MQINLASQSLQKLSKKAKTSAIFEIKLEKSFFWNFKIS
jgi:hypothetical protein